MSNEIHIGCVADSNLDMDYMLAAMMKSMILNHVSGEKYWYAQGSYKLHQQHAQFRG